MKITNLEVYELKVPFSIGVKSSSADFLKQDGMDLKGLGDTVIFIILELILQNWISESRYGAENRGIHTNSARRVHWNPF